MTGAFGASYTAAVRRLLGSVPEPGGVDGTRLRRAERHLGVRLPDALRAYYLALGGYRAWNDSHNRLLDPKDWFIDGGNLVFMVENQAVMYWGVEATPSPADDPAVFQGVNRLPEAIDWYPECNRCSEFLSVMIHWQAVMGGLEWLGTSDEAGDAAADVLTATWERVGGFGGMTAFARDGRAACHIADTGQLYVGGRTEVEFEQIATQLSSVGIGLDQL